MTAGRKFSMAQIVVFLQVNWTYTSDDGAEKATERKYSNKGPVHPKDFVPKEHANYVFTRKQGPGYTTGTNLIR